MAVIRALVIMDAVLTSLLFVSLEHWSKDSEGGCISSQVESYTFSTSVFDVVLACAVRCLLILGSTYIPWCASLPLTVTSCVVCTACSVLAIVKLVIHAWRFDQSGAECHARAEFALVVVSLAMCCFETVMVLLYSLRRPQSASTRPQSVRRRLDFNDVADQSLVVQTTGEPCDDAVFGAQ